MKKYLLVVPTALLALVLCIGALFMTASYASVYAATSASEPVYVDVYFKSVGYAGVVGSGDAEYANLREKMRYREEFSANETYHNYMKISTADLVFDSNNPLIFCTTVTPAVATTLNLTTNWQEMNNSEFNFSINTTSQGKFSDTVQIQLRKSTFKYVEHKFEKTPETNESFIELYTKIATNQTIDFSTYYGEKFFKDTTTDKPYEVVKKSASEIIVRAYVHAYSVDKFALFDGIVVNNEWQEVNNRWSIDGQYFGGSMDTPTCIRYVHYETETPEPQIQNYEVRIKKNGNEDFTALYEALIAEQDVKVLGGGFKDINILTNLSSITETEIVFSADLFDGQIEITKDWSDCLLALMNMETLDLYSVDAEARIVNTDSDSLAAPLNIALSAIGGLVVLACIGAVINYFTKKR